MKNQTEKVGHTPGEWRVRATDHRYNIACVFGGQPERILARCSGDDCEANATLIAAAPELLASLKAAVVIIDHLSEVGSHAAHPVDVLRMEDVIAKAENR